MPFLQTPRQVTSAAMLALLSLTALYAQDPPAQDPVAPASTLMQASPLLNVIDVNHDGRIDATELANAPARLKTLDKNADGKLTRDEAGLPPGFGRGPGGPAGREGRGGEAARGREAGRGGDAGGGERNFEVPIPGPTADELLAALLTFDKNKDGKLTRAEIPERQLGILDRGDTDKNGVLDAAELRKLTADQAAAPPAPPRGPARGGFGGMDLASTVLDVDRNGEISADEIANAATTLKTLDKNTDGSITEDEVRPAPGRGRGL
jgi:Ca2+-binding EF-hand superfamily protein